MMANLATYSKIKHDSFQNGNNHSVWGVLRLETFFPRFFPILKKNCTFVAKKQKILNNYSLFI